MTFAPLPPSIPHEVIDSVADKEPGLRTGMSSTVIPNAMGLVHPPAPSDDYARNVRQVRELDNAMSLVLQPTRAVKRKLSGLMEDSIACWLR